LEDSSFEFDWVILPPPKANVGLAACSEFPSFFVEVLPNREGFAVSSLFSSDFPEPKPNAGFESCFVSCFSPEAPKSPPAGLGSVGFVSAGCPNNPVGFDSGFDSEDLDSTGFIPD